MQNILQFGVFLLTNDFTQSSISSLLNLFIFWWQIFVSHNLPHNDSDGAVQKPAEKSKLKLLDT